MKKIVSGEELYEYMEETINILCDTVATTLGPIGNNIMIDHSHFSPFITNDGVTIAKNIESEDAITNTILELTKEASIKTDEMVGDGTTTTLVMLKSIFLEGLNAIRNGKKPIILKKELDDALLKILPYLEKYKKIPSQEDLLHIAISSANDNHIGENVFEAINKVKNKNAIFLSEHESEETKICYQNGYRFDTMLASPHFFYQKEKIELDQALFLLADNTFQDIEEIALILNEALEKQMPLVILANDYEEGFVNDILSLYFENKVTCILLKNPEYGANQRYLLQDLSVIAKGKIVSTIDQVDFDCIGKIQHMEIDQKQVCLSFQNDEQIENYIDLLQEKIEKEKEDSSTLQKRSAMLKTGTVEIKIGGIGKTERREKHMRYEDALCATSIALNGVLPGSGITLLKIKNEITPITDGEKILWNSLEKPWIQILENAGISSEQIYQKLKEHNFEKLYNVKEDSYEDIKNTKVLDPLLVVENTLKNATAIASLLLTTSHLVINEYLPKESNNVEEF